MGVGLSVVLPLVVFFGDDRAVVTLDGAIDRRQAAYVHRRPCPCIGVLLCPLAVIATNPIGLLFDVGPLPILPLLAALAMAEPSAKDWAASRASSSASVMANPSRASIILSRAKPLRALAFRVRGADEKEALLNFKWVDGHEG